MFLDWFAAAFGDAHFITLLVDRVCRIWIDLVIEDVVKVSSI